MAEQNIKKMASPWEEFVRTGEARGGWRFSELVDLASEKANSPFSKWVMTTSSAPILAAELARRGWDPVLDRDSVIDAMAASEEAYGAANNKASRNRFVAALLSEDSLIEAEPTCTVWEMRNNLYATYRGDYSNNEIARQVVSGMNQVSESYFVVLPYAAEPKALNQSDMPFVIADTQ